jgi:hypothetical protein
LELSRRSWGGEAPLGILAVRAVVHATSTIPIVMKPSEAMELRRMAPVGSLQAVDRRQRDT